MGCITLMGLLHLSLYISGFTGLNRSSDQNTISIAFSFSDNDLSDDFFGCFELRNDMDVTLSILL